MYCPDCALAHQADIEFSRAISGPYDANIELAVIWLLLMAPLLMPRAAEHSRGKLKVDLGRSSLNMISFMYLLNLNVEKVSLNNKKWNLFYTFSKQLGGRL